MPNSHFPTSFYEYPNWNYNLFFYEKVCDEFRRYIRSNSIPIFFIQLMYCLRWKNNLENRIEASENIEAFKWLSFKSYNTISASRRQYSVLMSSRREINDWNLTSNFSQRSLSFWFYVSCSVFWYRAQWECTTILTILRSDWMHSMYSLPYLRRSRYSLAWV